MSQLREEDPTQATTQQAQLVAAAEVNEEPSVKQNKSEWKEGMEGYGQTRSLTGYGGY